MILELNNRESKSSLHSTVVNCVWWECKYISQTVLDQKDIMMLYGAKVHQGTHFFFRNNFGLHKTSVYHVHNSALDSKSSFNAPSLVKSFDWLGDCKGSRSSPKIRAVNLLASKSRSGHSDTIRLAP